MDPLHVHLIITHLPIFGLLLGAIVLTIGILNKSVTTLNAAYLVFLISAGGAAIAYFTGESAEESVEHLQGVASRWIDPHEDSAKLALISISILAAFSLFSFFVQKQKAEISTTLAKVTLILSLISFGFSAYTGYLGGKIRHTEVGGANTTQGRSTGDSD